MLAISTDYAEKISECAPSQKNKGYDKNDNRRNFLTALEEEMIEQREKQEERLHMALFFPFDVFA